MNFQLNEDQQQLTDSLKRLLDNQYDFEARKKIVASAEGYSPAVWGTFAELGLLGLPLSEDAGGFGSPARRDGRRDGGHGRRRSWSSPSCPPSAWRAA